MQGHVLGQRHRQVKPQGQVGVALLEAVDLLFGFTAALCQQHVAGLNDGGVQGGEAVQGVGAAQHLHDALHLLLGRGEELHKAGQRPGGHFSHGNCLLFDDLRDKRMLPSQNHWDESENSLRGATQIQGPKGLLWPPLVRGGCRGRFRPRSAAVLHPDRTRRFQLIAPLSGDRCLHYCCGIFAVNLRTDCICFFGKCQAMGRLEGFTMQRQSRSPRARPSTSISAVAMLLA